MRILSVCPSSPVPDSGAEQMDRAQGMRDLRRMDHDVRVLARFAEHASSVLRCRTLFSEEALDAIVRGAFTRL